MFLVVSPKSYRFECWGRCRSLVRDDAGRIIGKQVVETGESDVTNFFGF